MARPVNADAAATRQRILESATMLFAEEGGSSSIREIAKNAGVSLAMVHHYFGSKDDLYAACVDAMYEELAELRGHLVAELEAARVAGPVTIEAIVEGAVRAGFRFGRSHQRAMRLMLRTVVATGALDQARLETFLLPFLAQGSAVVAGLNGRDPRSLRLPLQSLVFLHGRYAVADEAELVAVTGCATPDEAIAAVEEHLVDVAFATLGLSRAPTTTTA
ncbi:MAG: TetR family transcriptional regulator [Myxococcales bacterium]|nr:TetR family transcriptional regulator [Myxococcales bacterium]